MMLKNSKDTFFWTPNIMYFKNKIGKQNTGRKKVDERGYERKRVHRIRQDDLNGVTVPLHRDA